MFTRQLMGVCPAIFLLTSLGHCQKSDTWYKNWQKANELKGKYVANVDSLSPERLVKSMKVSLDLETDKLLKVLDVMCTSWYTCINKGLDFGTIWVEAKQDIFDEGVNLAWDAVAECITDGVKRVRRSSFGRSKEFDFFLEYYSVFSEMKQLCFEPRGSYRSFSTKVEGLRSESSILSTKLDILLDVSK